MITLKKHENVCKNYDYCYVGIPKEDNKILKYIHQEKSMKFSFIIYADMPSLLAKMSACHNNPKQSSRTKISKHRLPGYSLFTPCLFDSTNNKLSYYRGKDCMERFGKDLKEHATKIRKYNKNKK